MRQFIWAPKLFGILLTVGNYLSKCFLLMILDTPIILTYSKNLMMALIAQELDGYKTWLAIRIRQFGRKVFVKVDSELMTPQLFLKEKERLLASHLWLSQQSLQWLQLVRPNIRGIQT